MEDWLGKKSQSVQGEAVSLEANCERQKTDESNFSKIWRGEGLKESKIDEMVQKSGAIIF